MVSRSFVRISGHHLGLPLSFSWNRHRSLITFLLLLSVLMLDVGCFFKTDPGAFYGRIAAPRVQEFRWSDGGLPQVFDPAFAAAPPDTDAVRALFEGLTDYDPQTLKPVPAVALRWESANDERTWTFYLRDNAQWSNGAPVTAQDFVRSWKRTVKLGELAPHTELLGNIVGARPVRAPANGTNTAPAANQKPQVHDRGVEERNREVAGDVAAQHFGAEAVNDYTLRVHLLRPNADFPALVAHPVFRPVKVADEDVRERINAADLVSNGAFRLATTAADAVLLERADKYWGRSDVNLERVKFVGARDSETALAAYRSGEIDAVSNAAFEPLAIKLLSPYADYRRTTFGALTYYTFNTSHRPFDDVRVREALAIAIDRERISREEMGGATEPAHQFLPGNMGAHSNQAVVARSATLDQDLGKARELLAEAGYPDGYSFPPIRLLINRNEQQRLVAEAIAAMWLANLNIQTVISSKSWDEYEAAIRDGDYDLVRRGIVMQTTDEATNLSLLFAPETKLPAQQSSPSKTETGTLTNSEKPLVGTANREALQERKPPVESEVEALRQVSAIPIYFACSSALVKPYVSGFDSNVLDAPSLKKIRIDTGWRAPSAPARK